MVCGPGLQEVGGATPSSELTWGTHLVGPMFTVGGLAGLWNSFLEPRAVLTQAFQLTRSRGCGNRGKEHNFQ